jgi:hypothetical protein
MELSRSWLPKAARIWADMERGLYDWGGKKAPRNGDGSLRVVKSRILADCGVTGQYSGAGKRIWGSPEFQAVLAEENRRRDLGIANAIGEIEAVKGPLMKMGDEIIEKVADIFSREPDKDDPQALSPAEYVRLGREWFHEALEVEGKLESSKRQGIEEVLDKLSKGNQVTDKMLEGAMELVREYRQMQDLKLARVGAVEIIRE